MAITGRNLFTFLMAILFTVAPLQAQGEKLSIEGTVIDSTGGVLVGTDVFLRDTRSGLAIHQVTDWQGRFRFLVDQGSYELTAAETGFESVTESVAVQRDVEVDLEMAPEILADQVVVVSGSREQELSENSNTKVDIIPSTMLHDTGYETVRDVLSEEPGIITRSGSSGNRSQTQIQGIDSRQSLILIDGLPIVGAKGIKSGILNMDRQSVGRLERIEIVKGASSALYGSDAIGGVINMITREPTQALEGSVTASGGSLNRFDARTDIGFIKDKWSGFFEVERHKRNPYSLIADDIRTTGYGFHRYDYLGKLAYKFSENVSLRTMANAFDNQEKGRYQGTFGPTGTITNDSAQNYSAVMDIGLSPMTQWNLRGYYGKYDESSALDVFSQPGDINDTANLNQRLYRFDSSVSQVIGSRQLLQGGVEWTQDQYRGYNRVLGDNAGQGITMVDLWINDRISLHNRLSVTLGGRFNNHSRYGKHFVPRASALFRVTDDLRLRGAVGRGFRSPDLGQLYFRFQNPTHFYQVIGNTHLDPEESTTYQVGFDYNPSKFRFAVNFFRNDIKDLIQAEYLGFPTSPQELAGLLESSRIDPVFNPSLFRAFYHYQNVQNVYTAGIESRVELRLTRNLLLSSGYTYLDARDKETNAFLSQRHRHHGNFRIFYNTDRLGGLRTNLRGTYFGKWPIAGRRGSSIGDTYQIWDWYLAKPIKRGIELFTSADNLLDSRDSGLTAIQPTFFRADPGRLLRVGVRWKFGVE